MPSTGKNEIKNIKIFPINNSNSVKIVEINCGKNSRCCGKAQQNHESPKMSSVAVPSTKSMIGLTNNTFDKRQWFLSSCQKFPLITKWEMLIYTYLNEYTTSCYFLTTIQIFKRDSAFAQLISFLVNSHVTCLPKVQ